MREYPALFHSVQEIGSFVNIANQQPFAIHILDGKSVFDGKSILGLFDVHLNAPLTIRIDDRFADPQPFIDAIAPYIAAVQHMD